MAEIRKAGLPLTMMNGCRGADTGRFCVGLGSEEGTSFLRKLFLKYHLAPVKIYSCCDVTKEIFFATRPIDCEVSRF